MKITNVDVCLVYAMTAEAQPLIGKLQFKKIKSPAPHLPFEYYHQEVNGRSVLIAVNGEDRRTEVDLVSPVPATLNAQIILDKFSPEILVSVGTAGGVSKLGASIGDVYLGHEQIFFHDRRIPITGFDEYGEGKIALADNSELALTFGWKLGSVTTGSSLQMSPTDWEIIQSQGAVVKDMEAAAIAWVSSFYPVNFMAIKSITDLIDTNRVTSSEFLENLSLASTNLSHAVSEWLTR